MADIVKHVGRLKNSDRRCVVVFNQIPGREDHALVVDTDSLTPRLHDALMGVVTSKEGQSENQLSNILSRRFMPDDNIDVLNTLHYAGRLMATPVDNVLLYPKPNNPVPLSQVLEYLNASSPQKLEEITEKFNRIAVNQQTTRDEEVFGLAKNLIIEAELLEETAKSKREQAYKMVPSLRARTLVEEKVQTSTVNATDEVIIKQMDDHFRRVEQREADPNAPKTIDEAKRKPGRPVGTTKK